MKKIIVTGASGFIGRNCIELLRDVGYKIYACYRNMPACPVNDTEYVCFDLRDEYTVEKELKRIRADILLHLAWYVEPGTYMHASENADWLALSVNLIKNFVKYGGQKVVTAGSCAEYEWNRIQGTQGISEDFYAQNPSSVYGAAKSSLNIFGNVYMKECGLEYAHGRLFYLYGEGENSQRLIPQAISLLSENKTVELKCGRLIKDYLYVKDAARAFVTLIMKTTEGNYNIGLGKGYSLYEIINHLQKILGKQALIIDKNESEQGQPAQIVSSNEKLKQLGWEPHFSLEEGLTDYCIRLGLIQ